MLACAGVRVRVRVRVRVGVRVRVRVRVRIRVRVRVRVRVGFRALTPPCWGFEVIELDRLGLLGS